MPLCSKNKLNIKKVNESGGGEFMYIKYLKLILLSIFLSFLLYLSFKPWEYPDFLFHILMFSILLPFSIGIIANYLWRKKRAFWISTFFFFIGMLFLYRGFYLTGQFYLIDFILFRDIPATIEMGNKIIYTTPRSFGEIESIIVYCVLCILGQIIGHYSERKNP